MSIAKTTPKNTLQILVDDFVCCWRLTSETGGDISYRSSRTIKADNVLLTFPVEMTGDEIIQFAQTVSGSTSDPEVVRIGNRLDCFEKSLATEEVIDCAEYFIAMIQSIRAEGDDFHFCEGIDLAIPYYRKSHLEGLKIALRMVAIVIGKNIRLMDAHEATAKTMTWDASVNSNVTNYFSILSLWNKRVVYSYWQRTGNETSRASAMAVSNPEPGVAEVDKENLFGEVENEITTSTVRQPCRSTPVADLERVDFGGRVTHDFKQAAWIGTAASLQTVHKLLNKAAASALSEELDAVQEDERTSAVTKALDGIDNCEDVPSFGPSTPLVSIYLPEKLLNGKRQSTKGQSTTDPIELPKSVRFTSSDRVNALSIRMDYQMTELRAAEKGTVNIELPLDLFDDDDNYLIEMSQEETGEIRLVVRAGVRAVIPTIVNPPQDGPRLDSVGAGVYLLTVSDAHRDEVEKLKALNRFAAVGIHYVKSLQPQEV